MPVYYTLIVLLTVIIFFSILLILLKWTITIIIKCEERLSCHLNLFSVGQIINMMISFSTEETLISVRLFKRLLCFQKSSLSNHKPSENRKSSTRKRRSVLGTLPGLVVGRSHPVYTIEDQFLEKVGHGVYRIYQPPEKKTSRKRKRR